MPRLPCGTTPAINREAARLFGAADAARQRTGVARYPIFDADRERRLAAVRERLGESDFDAAWAEGAALRSRKPSPTRNAAGVSASVPQRLGIADSALSSTWPGWSAKAWATKRSPHGCSSHRGPCRPTSRTSTPNSGSPLGCSWPKKRRVVAEPPTAFVTTGRDVIRLGQRWIRLRPPTAWVVDQPGPASADVLWANTSRSNRCRRSGIVVPQPQRATDHRHIGSFADQQSLQTDLALRFGVIVVRLVGQRGVLSANRTSDPA